MRKSTPSKKTGSSFMTEESYPKGSYQTEKMQSKQKVVLDQHYSNNIFMTVLSTLESLEALFKNSRIKKEEKLYGHYDKVRFDDKNITELKSQLQTQLVLLKASRQVFQQENPSERYQHPDSFGQQKVKGELAYFSNVFKSDPQIWGMCRDFERIVEGDFNGKMKFQDSRFDLKYSEKQKISHQRGIVGRGVQASHEMDAQKREVQGRQIANQKELPIYINSKSKHYERLYPQSKYG